MLIRLVLPELDDQVQRLRDVLLGAVVACAQGVPDLLQILYISHHSLGLT